MQNNQKTGRPSEPKRWKINPELIKKLKERKKRQKIQEALEK